jgi:GNAT superfamily N-acetyltransferase/uncharacterized glyoxalase superfamily protein PhnB
MESSAEPFLSHAEPVLSVHNVTETVAYWQEILGFPNQWTWGEPPTHGGVSWHGAFVQFSQTSSLATVAQGQSVWIRVRHIEELYKIHQEKNAKIVSPLTKQPYGFLEYTVKDNNDCYISFASPASERNALSEALPDNVEILFKKPTVEQYRSLFQAVAWTTAATDEMLQAQLDLLQAAAVARLKGTENVVGCALLFGDGYSFYYVKDVMVHPDWQNKHVGTTLMQALSRWLDENAMNKALVCLFTGENLAPFYQQFNFNPAFGMIRIIDRHQPMP